LTARRVSNNKRGGSRWEVIAYLLFEEEELDSSGDDGGFDNTKPSSRWKRGRGDERE
jgi:hypothetical protein